MKRIHTLIVGAGQAGLAMSQRLSDRSIPHVVVERGEVANSWRTERWDSLRLLTPNWQSRLPGFAYSGPDPDGYMTMPDVVAFLARYAAVSAAPVETRTRVLSATPHGQGYRIETDKGEWLCDNLVLASGACNRANVPGFAGELPSSIRQLTPLDYRNPAQLPDGGVLVVGASASGVQLAYELRAAGRRVVLAAGNHIRMPRFYRGRDIQWWLDRSGVLSTTTAAIDDVTRARAVPSLQLVGDRSQQFLDLNTLQDAGVEIVGRLTAYRDGAALFSGGLANAATLSDLKMTRALAGFDAWAAHTGVRDLAAPERFAPTRLPASPRLTLDLKDGAISTIIWATGYRPDFSWLHAPVFDQKGRLVHRDGVVAPGLYALGLPFLRTRKSSLIDGVGEDAGALADRIMLAQGREAA